MITPLTSHSLSCADGVNTLRFVPTYIPESDPISVDGVGNSETIKALIADTGLQPNQFVFVDIYMLRSRHSNNKYHKVWLAETKRRFTLLEYDLSDVRAGTGRLPHCDLI